MTAHCAAKGEDMRKISIADYGIERLVDELFGTARYGDYCTNPVTGAHYIHGADPVGPQKKEARRALVLASGLPLTVQQMRSRFLSPMNNAKP